MASKNLETRQLQKARFLQEVEARTTALKEKGLSDQAIAKDAKIKHLKAKVRQIDSALGRISFLQDQTNKLKEKKAQRIAEEAAAKAQELTGGKKAKAKTEAQEVKAKTPSKGQAKQAKAAEKKKSK